MKISIDRIEIVIAFLFILGIVGGIYTWLVFGLIGGYQLIIVGFQSDPISAFNVVWGAFRVLYGGLFGSIVFCISWFICWLLAINK